MLLLCLTTYTISDVARKGHYWPRVQFMIGITIDCKQPDFDGTAAILWGYLPEKMLYLYLFYLWDYGGCALAVRCDFLYWPKLGHRWSLVFYRYCFFIYCFYLFYFLFVICGPKIMPLDPLVCYYIPSFFLYKILQFTRPRNNLSATLHTYTYMLCSIK